MLLTQPSSGHGRTACRTTCSRFGASAAAAAKVNVTRQQGTLDETSIRQGLSRAAAPPLYDDRRLCHPVTQQLNVTNREASARCRASMGGASECQEQGEATQYLPTKLALGGIRHIHMCLHMHTCLHMHACLHIHTCTHTTHTHTCVHTHTCTHHLHILTHIHTHTHMLTHNLLTRTYMHTHTCLHKHIHTCLHIHTATRMLTHTHTHMLTSAYIHAYTYMHACSHIHTCLHIHT